MKFGFTKHNLLIFNRLLQVYSSLPFGFSPGVIQARDPYLPFLSPSYVIILQILALERKETIASLEAVLKRQRLQEQRIKSIILYRFSMQPISSMIANVFFFKGLKPALIGFFVFR